MERVYEAFFLPESCKPFVGKLENQIRHQHVTTAFKPDILHSDLYGYHARFKAVGYGNDNKNEGYLVKMLSCDHPDLWDQYYGRKVPHLTISVSNGSYPKDTVNLDFEPVYDGEEFDTIFGAFDMETGKVIF